MRILETISDMELFSAGHIIKVINLSLSMDLGKKMKNLNVSVKNIYLFKLELLIVLKGIKSRRI